MARTSMKTQQNNQMNNLYLTSELSLELGSKAVFASTRKQSLIDSGKIIPAHIATTGTFCGYVDDDGEVLSFTLSRKMFDQAIKNFEREANPRPVYRGHADSPVISMISPNKEEAAACGWILGLQRRGDDLFALLELTEGLEKDIKEGHFRFTSIYLKQNDIDRKSGERIGARLISLAVTNQPFIDGLLPLALSEKVEKGVQLTQLLQKDIFDMSKTSTKKVLLSEQTDEEKEKATPPVVNEDAPEASEISPASSDEEKEEEKKEEDEVEASEDGSDDEKADEKADEEKELAEEGSEEASLLEALKEATGQDNIVDALKAVLESMKLSEASEDTDESGSEEGLEQLADAVADAVGEEAEPGEKVKVTVEVEGEVVAEISNVPEEEMDVSAKALSALSPNGLQLAVQKLHKEFVSVKTERDALDAEKFDGLMNDIKQNGILLSDSEMANLKKAYKTDKAQFDFMLGLVQKGTDKQVKRNSVLLSKISKPNPIEDTKKKDFSRLVLSETDKAILKAAKIDISKFD